MNDKTDGLDEDVALDNQEVVDGAIRANRSKGESNLEALADREIERRKRTAKSMYDNCPAVVKEFLLTAKDPTDFFRKLIIDLDLDIDFITSSELYDLFFPKEAQ